MNLSTSKKILLELLLNAQVTRNELEQKINITSSTLTYSLKKIKPFIKTVNLPSIGYGRPRQALILNPEYWYSIGIKIGREYISLTKFNSQFEIIEKYSVKITKDKMGNTNISKLLDEIFDKISNKNKIKAIGIAFSGRIVDNKVNSKILKLENYSPENIINKHFCNIGYVMLNDVEAIATEEYIKHKGENILVINYGTGIGACYYGKDGFRNPNDRKIIELGHFYAGGTEKCYCGAVGCLETVASDYAVLKKYKYRNLKISEFVENEEDYETDLKEIRNLYKNFKSKAEVLYNETFTYLTIFISNIFKILEPKKIILTGEGISPWFSQQLQKQLIKTNDTPIPIVYRGLENNIELGAAINALQNYILTKI